MSTEDKMGLEFLLALDDEEQLYNEIAGQFNEITGGFYATANLELLHHLHLKEQTKVLDLACGTGHLAIEIAHRIPRGRVTAVDLSPLMIARGREDAKNRGVKNIEFVERNIHQILPEFKEGDFDVGVSCFALSYLGCDFLLREMRQILGKRGQIGITTSSVHSLVEWQPLFFQFIQEFGGKLSASEIQGIPEMPLDAADLKRRLEAVGFQQVQVQSLVIPLIFENSREAASFLICSGWLSNYFFRIKDKKFRREVLEWGIAKIDEHHKTDPHIATSIEFLVGWNEPIISKS